MNQLLFLKNELGLSLDLDSVLYLLLLSFLLENRHEVLRHDILELVCGLVQVLKEDNLIGGSLLGQEVQNKLVLEDLEVLFVDCKALFFCLLVLLLVARELHCLVLLAHKGLQDLDSFQPVASLDYVLVSLLDCKRSVFGPGLLVRIAGEREELFKALPEGLLELRLVLSFKYFLRAELERYNVHEEEVLVRENVFGNENS